MMEARWYSLNRNGLATLCANEADAKSEAARQDRTWPQGAPHRAVQLVEASQLAAAVAEERQRCAQICRDHAADESPQFKEHEDTYLNGWLDASNECCWAIEGAE